jgi:hypothetical protein
MVNEEFSSLMTTAEMALETLAYSPLSYFYTADGRIIFYPKIHDLKI